MTREDDFEGLLAECVTRVEVEGHAALEDLCARHPAEAQRLRDGVERLRSVGLLADSSTAPLPERIGAYEITARLGRGGMGVVYLARDPRTGTPVAIKMGPAPLELGDRATARFEREMRALTGIQHTNLVRVLEVGSVAGRPYYTMDFIAGATVAEILDALRASGRGLAARDAAEAGRVVRAGIVRIAPDSIQPEHGAFARTWIEFACRIVLDAARALAHLHGAGIVHRDVKPANIIVDGEGRAFVFDLGLAHVDDEPHLTRTGDFAGTPHYVAPEVARGSAKSATPRSDVFALGVTLFEMLTLRPPFDGPNAAQVLAAIAERDAPSPRRIDPELPRDLETICATALEKDPARRYASMGDFAADLERFLAFRPVRARPVGAVERTWRFTKRRPALASAITLAALIVVGLPAGLWISNRSIREQRDRAEFAAQEALSQARTSGRVTDFLVELFRASGRKSESLRATEILERGSRKAEGDFNDQPLVHAALLEALGRVYSNFGARDKAVALMDRSLAIRQRELGENHADTARTIYSIGVLHMELGEIEYARALFERSLAALYHAKLASTADEALVCAALGEAHFLSGNPNGAAELLEHALMLQAGAKAPSQEWMTHTFELLGRAHLEMRSYDMASINLEIALDYLRKAYVPDLEARHRVLIALSDARRGQDLVEEADALRIEAGSAPPDLANIEPAASNVEWTSADSDELLALFQHSRRADYDHSFQRAITALQANDLATAESEFGSCLTYRPRDAVSAYDLACVMSLKNDVEGGLAWLAKAAEFGAGRSPTLLAAIEADTETAILRADPRGAELLARMRTDAGRAFEPAPVEKPEGTRPAWGWPLLVFMLDEPAAGRSSVIDPALLARSFGCAWIALKPRRLSSDDSSRRSVWVDSVGDFASRPWTYEEPLVSEISAACEDGAIDCTRVFLVSAESGGWIAFDLAARAPGIVRGALIVDGPVHPTLSREHAQTAAATGTVVRVTLAPALDGVERERAAKKHELCRRFLEHCGFGADSLSVALERGPAIESALRDVLAAPPARR